MERLKPSDCYLLCCGAKAFENKLAFTSLKTFEVWIGGTVCPLSVFMARSLSQACFLHLILFYWIKHPIRNTNCNRYICYVLFYHCGLLCLAKCFLRGNETKPQPRLGTRGIDSFNASGSFSFYLSESFFVDCGEWGDCLSFWSILRLPVDVLKNIFRVQHCSCHCNNSEMLLR